MQDEQPEDMEEDRENEGGFKAWLEDNLRIILSILVVFAIAGGIYSYSQRSQVPTLTEETESDKISAESDEKTPADTEEKKVDEKTSDTSEQPSKPATEKEEGKPVKEEKAVEAVSESRETPESFIETAVRGDGATHLARKALRNYLEKNPDSALSREHKVYIEDYLRKHTRYGAVRVGTSLEFSKSLIQEAIGKSKQLNDRQLTHLKKYSERAPSLR